jgi:hypothetical protein
MFIGLLKTKTNQIAIEHDTFESALQSLNRQIDTSTETVTDALILEETEYLDDQMPDFDSCRLVASLKVMR